MSRNLFRSSFGTYPHLLVGRDQLIDEFEDTFDGILDPAGLTFLVSAQRGMGKTVLLDSYRRAADTAGWLVITESSSSGLLERLTRDHRPRLLQQHSDKPPTQLGSANGTIGLLAGGASWTERYPAESTLRSQITDLTDALSTW